MLIHNHNGMKRDPGRDHPEGTVKHAATVKRMTTVRRPGTARKKQCSWKDLPCQAMGDSTHGTGEGKIKEPDNPRSAAGTPGGEAGVLYTYRPETGWDVVVEETTISWELPDCPGNNDLPLLADGPSNGSPGDLSPSFNGELPEIADYMENHPGRLEQLEQVFRRKFFFLGKWLDAYGHPDGRSGEPEDLFLEKFLSLGDWLDACIDRDAGSGEPELIPGKIVLTPGIWTPGHSYPVEFVDEPEPGSRNMSFIPGIGMDSYSHPVECSDNPQPASPHASYIPETETDTHSYPDEYLDNHKPESPHASFCPVTKMDTHSHPDECLDHPQPGSRITSFIPGTGTDTGSSHENAVSELELAFRRKFLRLGDWLDALTDQDEGSREPGLEFWDTSFISVAGMDSGTRRKIRFDGPELIFRRKFIRPARWLDACLAPDERPPEGDTGSVEKIIFPDPDPDPSYFRRTPEKYFRRMTGNQGTGWPYNGSTCTPGRG